MRTTRRIGLVKPVKGKSLEEGTLRHWEWQARSLRGRREHGKYTERRQWGKGRGRRVKWGLVSNKYGDIRRNAFYLLGMVFGSSQRDLK